MTTVPSCRRGRRSAGRAAAFACIAVATLWPGAPGAVEDSADSLAQGPPAGQVRIDDFWIDRYEYPNVPGAAPRVNVTWQEAADLCAERGQRLCTEAEWERACRGEEGHVYGYGPTFETGRCNTPYPVDGAWVRGAGTAVSGAFPDCGNANGVRDLIGNVWEWTDGWYRAERGWRVVRGGSWFHNANLARADSRYGRHLTGDFRLDLVGFRCCRSAAGD